MMKFVSMASLNLTVASFYFSSRSLTKWCLFELLLYDYIYKGSYSSCSELLTQILVFIVNKAVADQWAI